MDNEVLRSDARDRIAYLTKTIKKLQHEYYHGSGLTTASDRAFDLLFEELSLLEAAFPEFRTTDSPTRTVGIPKEHRRTVKYRSPAYSLDNVYDEDSLYKRIQAYGWAGELYADLKSDGLSLRTLYVDGVFRQAALRGDKVTGTDVTFYTSLIREVPIELPKDKVLHEVEVTGEITISREALDIINAGRQAENRRPYADQRQAAMGIFLSKSVSRDSLRVLSFTPHGVSGLAKPPKKHSEALELLHQWGFNLRDSATFDVSDRDALRRFYKTHSEQYKSSDHPTDGIVVRVNDLALSETLGYTERAPRFALAYKFPEELHLGVIGSINYAAGRTGVVTPLAVFKEPVPIDGIVVKQATLHSAGHVKNNGYAVGCTVFLHRGGGVGPTIGPILYAPKDAVCKLPDTCPSCGHPLTLVRAHLFCGQENECPQILLNRISFAVSKKCLNIDGIGPGIIQKMIDNTCVSKLVDLLDGLREPEWMSLYLSGYRINEIHRRVNTILGDLQSGNIDIFIRLILSLSIDGLTKLNLAKIMKTYGANTTVYFDDLPEILMDYQALVACGISKTTSHSISTMASTRYAEIRELLGYVGDTSLEVLDAVE